MFGHGRVCLGFLGLGPFALRRPLVGHAGYEMGKHDDLALRDREVELVQEVALGSLSQDLSHRLGVEAVEPFLVPRVWLPSSSAPIIHKAPPVRSTQPEQRLASLLPGVP